MASTYRLDWARPVIRSLPGERAYHATDGEHHILVVIPDPQMTAAQALLRSMRERDPDALMQDAIEEAIATATARRAPTGGELRLEDSDFD